MKATEIDHLWRQYTREIQPTPADRAEVERMAIGIARMRGAAVPEQYAAADLAEAMQYRSAAAARALAADYDRTTAETVRARGWQADRHLTAEGWSPMGARIRAVLAAAGL